MRLSGITCLLNDRFLISSMSVDDSRPDGCCIDLLSFTLIFDNMVADVDVVVVVVGIKMLFVLLIIFEIIMCVSCK
jgi:hypothetical protein